MMRTLRILFLSLALLIARAGAQELASVHLPPSRAMAEQDFRVIYDIPYVPNAAPRQRLNLYLAAQRGPARPLIVYIHGGAWRAGSKDECPARPLIALGYDVASVEYRFSQDAVFPAQIQDCKAAIRWLRANAEDYGYDPRRIGAWGASAGGQLVALLGVTGHNSVFDTGPNLDQSSAVQCVVDFFGPTDFLHYGKMPMAKLDAPDSAAAQLLGGPVSTHHATARLASAVYFVTRDAPPFLILHGDRDPLVPLQQSQELEAALQRAGVESTLEVIPGGGHGGPGFNTGDMQKVISDFLSRHLMPRG